MAFFFYFFYFFWEYQTSDFYCFVDRFMARSDPVGQRVTCPQPKHPIIPVGLLFPPTRSICPVATTFCRRQFDLPGDEHPSPRSPDAILPGGGEKSVHPRWIYPVMIGGFVACPVMDGVRTGRASPPPPSLYLFGSPFL